MISKGRNEQSGPRRSVMRGGEKQKVKNKKQIFKFEA
jgi:hypothetical protein